MRLESLPRGTGTLLLVDDDVAVLEVTGRLLEIVGYSVLSAPDAETAFELSRRNPQIRLIVLDLSLPGFEPAIVISRLREIAGDVPIVVMTGYPENETASRLQDQRIEGYLEKPFQPPMLLALLADVLADRP